MEIKEAATYPITGIPVLIVLEHTVLQFHVIKLSFDRDYAVLFFATAFPLHVVEKLAVYKQGRLTLPISWLQLTCVIVILSYIVVSICDREYALLLVKIL